MGWTIRRGGWKGRIKRIGGKAVYACKSSVLTRCLLFFASPFYARRCILLQKGNLCARYVYNATHARTVARIHIHGTRGGEGTSLFHPLLYPWIPLERIERRRMHFSRIRSIHRKLVYISLPLPPLPINNGFDIRWPIFFSRIER